MSIRVLVVDDSNLARRVIQQELEKDREIKVVGTAKDPIEASEKIEELNPDVMTLDMEMPKMDGLTFLKSLMRHHPMPVVVVSAYTKKGSRLAMEALEYGALDIVPKPGTNFGVREMSVELQAKVRAASQATIEKTNGGPATGGVSSPRRSIAKTIAPARDRSSTADEPMARRVPRPPAPTGPDLNLVLPRIDKAIPKGRIIAIGSSTGGTQALQYIISRLPENMPPIIIVQHMPPVFTKAFAERLDQFSLLTVKEAENHDLLAPGKVLVAPGGFHMELRGNANRYHVVVVEGEKVRLQRPSVEVMFRSVSKVAGKMAIGAILTGMGRDGADAMKTMKQAGAVNIAQDEQSCIVFGMPKEAIKMGGVDHVVSLENIPELLVKLV